MKKRNTFACSCHSGYTLSCANGNKTCDNSNKTCTAKGKILFRSCLDVVIFLFLVVFVNAGMFCRFVGLPPEFIIGTDLGLRIFKKPQSELGYLHPVGKPLAANKIEAIDAMWNPPNNMLVVFSDSHSHSIKTQHNQTLVNL